MVSLQESISPTQRQTTPETANSGNYKRKWDSGGGGEEGHNLLSKISKTKNTISFFDADFHLEKPLPLDWKQCLNVKSGELHFFNTRTQKRTCKDPRKSPERLSLAPMNLDLELNLPYNSLNTDESDKHVLMKSTTTPEKSPEALKRCTSWMTFEEDHKEMVASVCMKCNMLVMLCKSSPACPNCKFMHPLHEESPISVVKPWFSLLPCKD